MIVSDSKRFIYARIPKTASTSVSAALDPYRRARDRGWAGRLGRKLLPVFTHPLLVDFRAHAHWGLQAAREVLGEERFASYFKFTVVRHPVARTISIYNHILRHREEPAFAASFDYVYGEQLDLESFIETLIERPLPPQAMLVIDYGGNVLADAAVRVERLDAEISPLLDRLRAHAAIPQLNRANYRQQPLSSRAKAIIEECYAIDFDMFGYSRDGLREIAPLASPLGAAFGRRLQCTGASLLRPWQPLPGMPELANS